MQLRVGFFTNRIDDLFHITVTTITMQLYSLTNRIDDLSHIDVTTITRQAYIDFVPPL